MVAFLPRHGSGMVQTAYGGCAEIRLTIGASDRLNRCVQLRIGVADAGEQTAVGVTSSAPGTWSRIRSSSCSVVSKQIRLVVEMCGESRSALALGLNSALCIAGLLAESIPYGEHTKGISHTHIWYGTHHIWWYGLHLNSRFRVIRLAETSGANKRKKKSISKRRRMSRYAPLLSAVHFCRSRAVHRCSCIPICNVDPAKRKRFRRKRLHLNL